MNATNLANSFAQRLHSLPTLIAPASAVLLGAFAAHGLKASLSPEALAVFETGVRYQMYHALALGLCRYKYMSISLLQGAGLPVPPESRLLERIGDVDGRPRRDGEAESLYGQVQLLMARTAELSARSEGLLARER